MADSKSPTRNAHALSMLQALRRLQQAAEVHSKSLGRDGELTPLHLLILQVVELEGEITAGQLARHVALSQSSLSSALARLESRGLLSRRRDDDDRRKQWLSLEGEGQRALRNAPELLPEHALERFAGLPEWEQHAILAGLLRAAELFEAPEVGAEPEEEEF
ncbi:MarR family winged helix-turn-helix transcriptional regulator [Pseudomonas sp. ZM23]|uniref:MarR family winged helix-turn-helix transcriptional regulator n=1 Tax=Pseudomonas triclosanedens TaxID=2961893 RepID=A0ABY7A3D1_9PSED|nr:MarR family winged helix-turn-helix transcriptional regulator [Pseudomonas triclosanedens]MCP8464714.1 MarR family winged helix-turn-helix transcriptional regulator [Pseudomonas triclosanedens]MCP8470573.1 MarR family winged helix-turn-helix transcriptional regulator [Pseudomonas triclosanedens]MCP8476379.1 MarR family winged helix-turn-helix transcriptional regulator [Pseudomonas triclosanedens]WAI51395.1 MarR family winged helix-turn-helix transcriptional regulator [Pseudomonas triclosaned